WRSAGLRRGKSARSTKPYAELSLKRAVHRKHAVGRAPVFPVTDIGAIKIESAVRLVSGLGRQSEDGRNLPIRSQPRSYLGVGQQRVIQSRMTLPVAKVIPHSETGLLYICARVKREAFR